MDNIQGTSEEAKRFHDET